MTSTSAGEGEADLVPDVLPRLEGVIADPAKFGERGEPHPWTYKTLTIFDFTVLSAFQFAFMAMFVPVTTVLIPHQISHLPDVVNKGTALGEMLFTSSAVSILFSPLCGGLSDQCQSQFGRRRPFIVVGTFLAVGSLLGMAFSTTFPALTLFFSLFAAATSIVTAPYSALIPDVIPEDQVGKASGFLGGIGLCGSIVGGIVSGLVTYLDIVPTYLLLILIMIICSAVTCVYVPEVQFRIDEEEEYWSHFFDILWDHDFVCVFASRFWMQLGVFGIQQQAQYFLEDTIPKGEFYLFGYKVFPTALQNVTILLMTLICAAAVAAPIAGMVVDYIRVRKPALYVSSVIMAVGLVVTAFSRNFTLDWAMILVFGVGVGIFCATDYAIAVDVLHNPAHNGKNMGLWTLALTCPQMVSGPLVGNIVDSFRASDQATTGWIIVMNIMAISVLYGAYLLKYTNLVH